MNINDECFMTELSSIVLMNFYSEHIQLPVIHEEEQPLVQYFEENVSGNDYVVGDIHCQFTKLDKQLDEIGFNKEKDRLFCVGDLIDRGDDGYRALDYLKQPWFHSVMGNHEDMILSLLGLPNRKTEVCYKMAMQNGAEWLIENNKKLKVFLEKCAKFDFMTRPSDLSFEKLMGYFPELEQLYFEFSKLPYIIQIGENVGIVHAEVPLFIKSWSDLKEKVEDQHIDTMTSLLWGRMRVSDDINKEIKGINTIYCGHNVLPEANNYGNHRVIDTGAYAESDNKLHIEKIDYNLKINIDKNPDDIEVYNNNGKFEYVKLSDVSEENIEEFKKLLKGRSCPLIENEGDIAFHADYKEFISYKRAACNNIKKTSDLRKKLEEKK